MKKIVIVCGLISGIIVSTVMVISIAVCYDDPNFQGNMWLGYASMLLAFSLVFVGIKQVRDKQNGGVITFGQAFRTGLYITLIGSTAYVFTWVIDYYLFIPDFMDKYVAHALKQAQESGATKAELDKQMSEMSMYQEMYKNPLFVVLLTYMEILPLGIIVTLICAFILKRKTKTGLEPQAIN